MSNAPAAVEIPLPSIESLIKAGALFVANHSGGKHSQGRAEKPKVCAGFLLRGGAHNLAVRLGFTRGRFRDDVSDGGHVLHDNFRAMAIANGVDPDDSILTPCR